MSVFGGAVSNVQTERRNDTSRANGYSDERRNGRKKHYKEKTLGNNYNTNAATNSTNASRGANGPASGSGLSNVNGVAKRVWRKQDASKSRSLLPLVQDISNKVIPKSNGKYQSFTSEQIALTGPIISQPEVLGFKRGKTIPPRPIPKYLLDQPRLLVTLPFKQNAWDKQNQQTMENMELANKGKDYQGLYEEFQKMREIERKQMESLGLVDAENISKDLTDAISFQGSCTDMCPVFERVRRQLENNVKALEKDPITNVISRELAVKAFSRPAAGQPPPLPSEVRPPHILKQTLDYLVDNIVEKLPEAHSFIWDRTRSIRQDFTYQNSFGPEAIDCNERIVRIHLLSLHIMAGADVEYSQQQELEQFNKSMQTLIEIYQDVRNHGGKCPNEAEFRAYHLLSHYRDPELEREIQTLPNYIFQDPQVQLALKLRNIISQNNIVERGHLNSVGALNLFVEFFRVVYSDETPFLMSCLLETHFNEIRFYALKAMARSYHTKGKAYSAEALKDILGYDSLSKLIKFVEYYEIDVLYENSEVLIDLFNKEKLQTKYKLNSIQDKPKLSQTYSSQLDLKIRGKSLKDFINQGHANASLGIKTDAKIVAANSIEAVAKPIAQGFGSNSIINSAAPVFNTQPIQSNPPKSIPSFAPTSKSTPTFSFGSSKPATSAPSLPEANVSASLFSQKPKELAPKTIPSFTSVNVPKFSPKVDFGASQKSKTTAPTLVKNVEIQDKSNFTVPSVSFLAPKVQESTPNFPVSVPKVVPKPEPVLKVVPERKKLSSLPQFNQAVSEVMSQLITKTIEQELSSFLPKLIEKYSLIREHEEIVKTLGNELYQAFISEIIYNTTLEAQADFIYLKNLRLHSIRQFLKVAQSLQKKNELKQKKANELHSISFKKNGLKRFVSNSETSFTKRRNTSNISTSDVISKQLDIEQLWSPIDLKAFLSQCSQNLKISIETHEVQLNFLLVVENWSSMYSKWLNSKLSLKANLSKLNYEKQLTNDKINMTFTSLPSKNYLNKDFFSNTSFILFECGMVRQEEITIKEKLTRDKAILNKIVSLVDKFSYYKVQIILVYWDVTESGITEEEIKSLLDVAKLVNDVNTIQDIILCDMTSKDTNINEMIINGFETLSKNFKGELTIKGQKKKQKLVKLQKHKRPETPPVMENTFKQREENIFQKAKKLKRYDYLTQHILKPTGINSTINTTTMAPPSNTSFNNSFINNLTMQRRNNDSTFINLNTTGNTTFNNNVSILAGFGNELIEESTPVASPRRPTATSTLSKLQELRQLTAGVATKYKK